MGTFIAVSLLVLFVLHIINGFLQLAIQIRDARRKAKAEKKLKEMQP